MALKWHYLPAVITLAVVCLFDVSGGVSLVVRAKQGSSALLTCSVDPPSEGLTDKAHVVEWVRQGYDTPVLIKFGAYATRVHPNYEGRVSLSGGTDLLVEGLILDDGGWYECRILMLDKPSDETRNGSWTLLSVTASPVFTETPPLVTEAFSGRPYTLKCVAHGNPPPTIKWYKDGILMNHTGSVKILNGSLVFTSMSRNAVGHYQCHASNSEGNKTCFTQLRVKGPPAIIIPPTNTILNMSQNALLQCQAEADPPNMTYVWLREGENVYHMESLKTRVKVMVDGTLLISHLQPGDSGNYTCMPTNGLPAPPTASAILTVQYPAQVFQMPGWTFLPTGMRGVISCPLIADPPLLRVAWTKDGKVLDLREYPGWILTAEGSIVIATTNDDAAGVYTCTPYNSYGTMGQSEPTTVILQDPPSLRVPPRSEYREQVGQTLRIPCQAYGDPPPAVKWAKPGASSSSFYSITSNGSLLLQPLGKEHHGEWECHVTNRVATITAPTSVLVLGTSPHAVSSVSVRAEINQANISWEPGFDGGYTQSFTVWLRCACADGEHQEWQSVLTTSSSPSLLVTGLLPSTEYQFSVMARNRLGSGPFSEITTARTLEALPEWSRLEPPTQLSFNQSTEGVYLWWAAPPPHLPIDGFLLQSRLEKGEWLNLDENISPNKTDVLIKGLQKNSNYELRLLSRSGEKLSLPSHSVNISTLDVEEYMASSRLLEFAPQQLLVGAMALLCLAFLLALATVCVINQRRRQRQQKYTQDLHPVGYNCPSVKDGTTPDSPESILKQNLLPSCSLSSSSSSEHSFGRSSYSDYHGQRHHLLPHTLPSPSSLPEPHLHRGPKGSPAPVELIHRGPDGRFMVQPYEETKAIAPSTQMKPRKGSPKISEGTDSSMVQKSHSYGEGRKNPPFILSVEVPTCSSDIFPSGTMRAIPEQLSLQTFPAPFKEQELSNRPPDQSSLISESSSSTLFPSSEVCKSMECSSTRSVASTLILQMEHEKERGNLSHCLRLAREREELERELRRYTLERDRHVNYHNRAGSLRVEQNINAENNEDMGIAMGSLQAEQLSCRGHCVSNNPSISSIRASACTEWEDSLLMTAQALVPVQVAQGRDAKWSHSTRCSQMSKHYKSRSLERGEHQKSYFKDQKRRRTLTEGAPVCVKSFYPTLERADYPVKGSLKNARTHNLSQHCIVPGLNQSVHNLKDRTMERSEAGDCVEMCVDEPEVQTQSPLTRSMLDQSHDMKDYQRPSLYQLEINAVEERVAGSKITERGFSCDLEHLSRSSRTLPSVGGQRPALQSTVHKGSQHISHHKSTPSLNSNIYKELFLTPDAWINSLSLVENSPASFTADQHSDQRTTSIKVQPRGSSWLSSHCQSPETHVSPMHRKEDDEEDGGEVDVELQGYRSVLEFEGSCRSYASQSSGRGSLDQRSSRQSLSFSPMLTCSPTATESDREEAGPQGSTERERRGSGDESYEWDSHCVAMDTKHLNHPISRDGLGGEILLKARGRSGAEEDHGLALNQENKGLFPWVSVVGSVPVSGVSSVLTANCDKSPLAQEILHDSTSYPDHEPDAVLF